MAEVFVDRLLREELLELILFQVGVEFVAVGGHGFVHDPRAFAGGEAAGLEVVRQQRNGRYERHLLAGGLADVEFAEVLRAVRGTLRVERLRRAFFEEEEDGIGLEPGGRGGGDRDFDVAGFRIDAGGRDVAPHAAAAASRDQQLVIHIVEAGDRFGFVGNLGWRFAARRRLRTVASWVPLFRASISAVEASTSF